MRENWFCPLEKCEHYNTATKYSRKCYYGEPQCWKGYLDTMILVIVKLKTARTLMAIILISVCGWVAVVGLVIEPPFWLGAILSIIGGIAIGTVVAYLMRRWWFRRHSDSDYQEIGQIDTQ